VKNLKEILVSLQKKVEGLVAVDEENDQLCQEMYNYWVIWLTF